MCSLLGRSPGNVTDNGVGHGEKESIGELTKRVEEIYGELVTLGKTSEMNFNKWGREDIRRNKKGVLK